MIVWYMLLTLLGLDTGYTVQSASMQPTLVIGYAYSARNIRFYRRFGHTGVPPIARGDIVTFEVHDVTYSKRVIGLPGEAIQIVAGRLLIDGVEAERSLVGKFIDENSEHDAVKVTRYWQHLPGGVSHLINEISDAEMLDNTEVFSVPAGHYFTMGDNRDRSVDSRVVTMVGYVPAENIISKFLTPMPLPVASVPR